MPQPMFPPLLRYSGRPSRRRRGWAMLVLLPLAAALPVPVGAQTTPPDLTRLSIEDLMNIEITSASRKEQRIMDVSAAVFVITQDDIRRSGMTAIPDLLRLVPGVNVAQINSNKWAVSVRGFNGLFTNKLLVLVDGRSVYDRLSSGVIWETVDLMADDIDRIEVIRGPGATAWGANAVNGVINIVTKTAADSQGGLVRGDAGQNGTQAAVRYGGTAFNTPYRVFAQWTGRDETILVPGVRAGDASYNVTAGLRADRTTARGVFMLEGAFTAGRTRLMRVNLDAASAATASILRSSSDARGGHVLGRWAFTPKGVSLQIQSSLELAGRREAVGHFTRTGFDLDAQARKTLGARHDLVAGVGYRRVGERLDGQNNVSPTSIDLDSTLLTAFLQDDMALAEARLHLILGTQVQHDSLSGGRFQPNVRLMWNVRPRQRLWAAASRALATVAQAAPGGTQLHSEKFADLEAGYRIELGTAASFDVTAFVGRYEDLIPNEVSAPVAPGPRSDVTSATSRGVEVAAHWAPVPAWGFDASIAILDIANRLRDVAGTVGADVPRAQSQLHIVFRPASRATITASLFHVGRLPVSAVDAYRRADMTVEWRVGERLAIMAIGQNLLMSSHPEFTESETTLVSTRVPRSISARVRWRF
jgi:iron complex outermembrane receptor protein